MTATVTDEDMDRLCSALGELPAGLLSKGDSFTLVLDMGCSQAATPFHEDFVKGTLTKMTKPLMMSGIAGGLKVTHEGRVRYEMVTDKGELKTIETEAYLIPELTCRLVSPQDYVKSLDRPNAHFATYGDRALLDWGDGTKMMISYDDQTFLPVIRGYHDALNTASALALRGGVSEETNQNLTKAQRLLLRYHFKLGHLAFAAVQWIGRQGWLGPQGEHMGHGNLQAPKCAACLYGKQGKTPTSGKHIKKDESGALLKGKLEPGQLFFSDQYQSRVPGRAYTIKGGSSSIKYQGGTLFYDAASGKIFISHQVGLTAEETIQSKIRIEREAMGEGISIQAYHTDNGIYASKEFLKELAQKGQGLKMSGVRAQFQNGAAENGIKIVVQKAQTMMLHCALRWPGYADKELWPMALSHAVYLYNSTPTRDRDSLSPNEIFAKTKSEHNALRHAHPWGCPAYVLAPRLKDGQKIPKWEPRSRCGQYMGTSPMHASTVGLVRNLQTGSITPQFHVVYDDFYETVHSDDNDEPQEWPDLVVFNSFRSEVDEDDGIPDLADEWLNPDERRARQAERARAKQPREEPDCDQSAKWDQTQMLRDQPRTDKQWLQGRPQVSQTKSRTYHRQAMSHGIKCSQESLRIRGSQKQWEPQRESNGDDHHDSRGHQSGMSRNINELYWQWLHIARQ